MKIKFALIVALLIINYGCRHSKGKNRPKQIVTDATPLNYIDTARGIANDSFLRIFSSELPGYFSKGPLTCDTTDLLYIDSKGKYHYKDEVSGWDVYLSRNYKTKVAIYSSTNKDTIIKYLGDDSIKNGSLVITLIKSNDSMYYVDAFYTMDAKNSIKGWISKKTRLSVYSVRYDDKLILHSLPNKKSKKISFKNNLTELDVLDYKNKWLRVETSINGQKVTGWLPPER